MNKKITTAMLLVLIQSSIYSAQHEEEDSDWMSVTCGKDGKLQIEEDGVSKQPTQDQATNTGGQPTDQEAPAGCCAVVADLLEKGLKVLKNQAYGKPPFPPDETINAKNK
jgi:hypothetical protein